MRAHELDQRVRKQLEVTPAQECLLPMEQSFRVRFHEWAKVLAYPQPQRRFKADPGVLAHRSGYRSGRHRRCRWCPVGVEGHRGRAAVAGPAASRRRPLRVPEQPGIGARRTEGSYCEPGVPRTPRRFSAPTWWPSRTTDVPSSAFRRHSTPRANRAPTSCPVRCRLALRRYAIER